MTSSESHSDDIDGFATISSGFFEGDFEEAFKEAFRSLSSRSTGDCW